jgi:hypothetical protein
MTEDEFEAALYNFVGTHFRTAAKSILIGFTIFWFVAAFTGSIWKATVIGVSCLVFSAFHTWRRFLEPIAFILFCAGMVYWCDPDIFQRAKTLLADFSSAR